MKRTIRVLAMLMIFLLTATMAVACQKEEPKEEGSAFAVTLGEVTVALGRPAEPILSALGAPKSQSEVFDCGEGNSRIRYRYDSLTVYTMKSDGKEVVDQVELMDDLAQTSRGICIGDDEAKVREAYGNPTSDKNGVITYSKSSMQLLFEIENGKVSAIGLLRKTR